MATKNYTASQTSEGWRLKFERPGDAADLSWLFEHWLANDDAKVIGGLVVVDSNIDNNSLLGYLKTDQLNYVQNQAQKHRNEVERFLAVKYRQDLNELKANQKNIASAWQEIDSWLSWFKFNSIATPIVFLLVIIGLCQLRQMILLVVANANTVLTEQNKRIKKLESKSSTQELPALEDVSGTPPELTSIVDAWQAGKNGKATADLPHDPTKETALNWL